SLTGRTPAPSSAPAASPRRRKRNAPSESGGGKELSACPRSIEEPVPRQRDGDVVIAAGLQGGVDQRVAGVLGVGVTEQDFLNLRRGHPLSEAVRAQE